MTNPVIRVENLSKYYRLGVIGGGTLREDVSRWWARKIGKIDDPYSKIGEDAGPQPRGGQIWALEDINLEVNEGEILGVIGRNGAGKSTLLKILSRITAPSSGRAVIKGRVGSLLEVGTGFHPELTGRENIYLNGAILGMRRAEVSRKLHEIVDFSEVSKFVDTPVKRYSSGMLVRLAFAVAAHLEPEVLIVDEVLAVGDASFQKRCISKMESIAGSGMTILFVSHNMASIQNLTSRCMCLANGTVCDVGATDNVIQTYLSEQSTKSQQEVELVMTERRSPELGQKVRLTKLEAIYGNELGFEWGTEFTFGIGVESKVECLVIRFGFTIMDAFGNAILSFSTQSINLARSGARSYEVRVPTIKLVPGTYRVGLSVFQGSFFEGRTILDLVHPDFEFNVFSSTNDKPVPDNWNSNAYGSILEDDAIVNER